MGEVGEALAAGEEVQERVLGLGDADDEKSTRLRLERCALDRDRRRDTRRSFVLPNVTEHSRNRKVGPLREWWRSEGHAFRIRAMILDRPGRRLFLVFSLFER